ncbi:MAG: phosphate/phosphite/phosphonate ABC transporter substrate-binding protein [Candidatus Electrothrix sp. EH2]|nr:phosphate/phosphite/phosphonate ABC transporter substrate-binding protein [Candidatus Electrothrix sp. EH2]
MKKIIQCILVLAVVFTLQACKTDKGSETPAASAVSESTEQPAAVAIDTDKPILRFGYMICDSLKLSEERFAPFTAYLEKKLGRRVEMILKNTFEMESLVKNKEIDFFHVNSIVAILLKEKYKADLLAIDIRGKHGYKATGTIIARKDSGIKTIEDMRGKSMVFGPALAPFGYMAQYALLLENDFDPETDFSSYTIPSGSAKHDKVIYGVEYGKYDVGAAPRIDLDRLVEENIINIDEYNIIAESEPMPYCTIGARAEVDPDLKEQVKNIALNLQDDEVATVDGETLKVLKRMLIEGFAPVVDSEYDAIREDLKLCNMPPYTKY